MLVVATAAILSLLSFRVFRRLLRRYLLQKYTCVLDLEQVGTPRDGAKLRGTAVIWLFTARICSDHFAKVVIVEPDAWTFTREAREPTACGTREVEGASATYRTLDHKRKRVPQYTAAHTFQVILLRFAHRVFPGFDAVALDWGMLIRAADARVSLSGHALHPPVGEYNGALPETVWAPRRNLEALIRKMVYDGCPEIEFVKGTLTAFRLGDVRTRGPNIVDTAIIRLPDGTTREIQGCALAVDCTGAAQAGFKALSRILPALSAPGLRDSYSTNVAYSTLEYPLPPGFYESLHAVVPGCISDDTAADFAYVPDPDVDNKLVAFLRCEAGAVTFTIGGWDVSPPVTLDEVRSFAQKVKNQAHIPDRFYRAVDLLEPVKHLGVVQEAHITTCQIIHYERLSHALPCNYVAIGDSAMRVNPRFAQGVSKCTIGAVTLDAGLRTLAATDHDFGASFFSKMHDRTDNIWDSTKLADYALDTTTPVPGESRQIGRFKVWYRNQLIRSIGSNPAAASAIWHTLMFLAPPTDVFSPAVLAGIFWSNIVNWVRS
ncbi:hypothetical protein AURDEDRAFT_187036 [Auricularia subglabra TFB-10046 SS5]|nr:hypothetical protein AURDEDRAFT_187036 [Auricularia subglabra TFB-10046 SS5]